MGGDRIIEERFWIMRPGSGHRKTGKPVWSTDLSTTGAAPPPEMMELAQALIFKDLPTGVIVGSAVIEKVTPAPSSTCGDGMFQWHLADVERAKRFRKPKGHPRPAWFKPF